MHELSVCSALVAQVEEIAQARGARRVLTIHLELGPLSGVEADLLRRAYPVASAGTIAEGADLIINTSDVSVHCTQCGAQTRVEANRLLCGECGEWRTQLISGDELVLQSVEFETANPEGAVALAKAASG